MDSHGKQLYHIQEVQEVQGHPYVPSLPGNPVDPDLLCLPLGPLCLAHQAIPVLLGILFN